MILKVSERLAQMARQSAYIDAKTACRVILMIVSGKNPRPSVPMAVTPRTSRMAKLTVTWTGRSSNFSK